MPISFGMRFRSLLRRLPVKRFREVPPVVAVLRFHGIIAPRGPRTLSLGSTVALIERAFTLPDVAAVALVINSPGGSPVQSALIHRRVRQLSAEKNVPVLAFAEDVAASGGYWLALAGDEIWAEETSIVGSIGVVSSSFGFSEAIRRLGVERRLYTAGEHKALLDPFLAEDARGVDRLKSIQADMHESFKDLVRQRRGGRLAADDATLFNGDVFTGRTALKHGLIDGIGELRGVMRERFGEKVRLRLVEPPGRRRWLPSLPLRFGRSDPADLVADLLATVEERLVWSRFGL
jgi:signal peptide peptidase SppA